MNLLEMAQSAVTPRFVDQASAYLGEPPDKVRLGLAGALPGVLGGFIDKGSTREGASEVLTTVSRYEDVGTTEGDADSMRATASKSEGLLSGIFNGKGSSVEDGISRYSGMKKGSIHALMGMAAPLIAGLIGREARRRKLDAEGLRSMLGDSRDAVSKAAPPGVLDSFPGRQDLGTTVGRPAAYQDVKVTRTEPVRTGRATYAERPSYTERKKPAPSHAGRWILLAVLAIAALAALLMGRGRPTTPTEATAPAPVTQSWNCSDGRTVSVQSISQDQVRLNADNQSQLLNRSSAGAFEGSGWSWQSQGNTAKLQHGGAAVSCSLQP